MDSGGAPHSGAKVTQPNCVGMFFTRMVSGVTRKHESKTSPEMYEQAVPPDIDDQLVGTTASDAPGFVGKGGVL
jgi:hypothetical protein